MPTVGKTKIVVVCTSCEGQFRVGAEHDGHRIRCPKCGEAFVARAGSAGSAAAAPSAKPSPAAGSKAAAGKTAGKSAAGETGKSKPGDPLLGKRLKQFRLQRIVGKGGRAGQDGGHKGKRCEQGTHDSLGFLEKSRQWRQSPDGGPAAQAQGPKRPSGACS